jgi:hypothetical protein
MIKITDKTFHYTPSYSTDLKKKFRRLQAEQRAAEATARAQARAEAEEREKHVVTFTSRRNAYLPKQ